MFTSYILDKDALALLWKLCGGSISAIPDKIRTDMTFADASEILQRLERLGVIHISNKRADIERTVGFLITSMVNSKEVKCYGNKVVFKCERLFIIAETDRLSKRKCRIIPAKDKTMLEEYLAENTDSACNEEDER